MKRYFLPILLSTFVFMQNSEASEYSVRFPAKGIDEKHKGEPPKPKISFEIIDGNGSGTTKNLNDANELSMAYDGDLGTATDRWQVVYTNSWRSVHINLSRPVTGTVTFVLEDNVTNGYGNRYDLNYGYINENGFNRHYHNPYLYSNSSWTRRTFTSNVVNAHALAFSLKHIGKGSPSVRLVEITVNEAPE